MKISCIQMNMQFASVEENFLHAAELISDASKEASDIIVLPETWNTGFFPKHQGGGRPGGEEYPRSGNPLCGADSPGF